MMNSTTHSVGNKLGGASSGAVKHPPRRPMNAFLLFCKRHRTIVKEQHPHLENRLISKILGEWWTSLEPAEKANFNNLASAYKDHLMKEQPNFSYKSNAAKLPVQPAALSPQKSCKESASQRLRPRSSGRNSSGASSPEDMPASPSLAASTEANVSGSESSGAPKPFKKRYLAAEKAKMSSNSTSPNLSSCPSPSSEATAAGFASATKEKKACEALLQLAEGVDLSQVNGAPGAAPSKASSASPSPPLVDNTEPNFGDDGGLAQESFKDLRDGCIKLEAEKRYPSVREAVWTKIRKTLLTQQDANERSKMNATSNENGQPINLTTSTMTKIHGQTIIEHVIENILDKPLSTVYEQRLNNNENVDGTTVGAGDPATEDVDKRHVDDEERVKEKIYASLRKAARSSRGNYGEKNAKGDDPQPEAAADAGIAEVRTSLPKPLEPVSITRVSSSTAKNEPDDQPLNLSTTPPQTPASASPKEAAKRRHEIEDHEDAKKQRTCKGRRYQEFRDAVGRKGRRSHHKSGGSDHQDEPACQPLASPEPARQSNGLTASTNPADEQAKAFDVEKELNAIPALSLESFQQKVFNSRQQQQSYAAAINKTAVPSAVQGGGVSSPQRQSLEPVKNVPMAGCSKVVASGGVSSGALNAAITSPGSRPLRDS